MKPIKFPDSRKLDVIFESGSSSLNGLVIEVQKVIPDEDAWERIFTSSAGESVTYVDKGCPIERRIYKGGEIIPKDFSHTVETLKIVAIDCYEEDYGEEDFEKAIKNTKSMIYTDLYLFRDNKREVYALWNSAKGEQIYKGFAFDD